MQLGVRRFIDKQNAFLFPRRIGGAWIASPGRTEETRNRHWNSQWLRIAPHRQIPGATTAIASTCLPPQNRVSQCIRRALYASKSNRPQKYASKILPASVCTRLSICLAGCGGQRAHRVMKSSDSPSQQCGSAWGEHRLTLHRAAAQMRNKAFDRARTASCRPSVPPVPA